MEAPPDTPSSAHKLERMAQTRLEQLTAAEELAAFRHRENDRMAAELRTAEARLAEKAQATAALQRMVDEADAARIDDQLEIKRLRREVEMLSKHAERERTDAEARAEELGEFRKSAAVSRIAVLNELDKAKMDKDAAESALLSCTQQAARMRAQQSELEAAVASAREATAQVQSASEAQLAQQARVIAQLKQTLLDADKDRLRADALVAQANAKLAAVDEERQRYVTQAMEQVQMVERAAAEDRQAYEARIAQLEARLRPDATALALADVSPALASEQLEKQGLTLTGLYVRTAQEHDARVQAEAEVARLSGYLNRIMREVEAKAPELAKLRAEHQAALANHDAMAEKLSAALKELGALRAANAAASRRADEAADEAAQAKQEAADLARQVQSLLSAQLPSAPAEPQGAADVISITLVPFRNVAELHEQNIKLLRVVRQLSALEDELQSRPDAAGLARAMDEIRALDEARQRQEELVQAIVRQRDMYRALLAQADAKHAAAAAASSSSLEDQPLTVAASTTSSGDVARLREELAHMSRDYQAQLDALRQELAAARSQRVQAETARDFLEARVKSLGELHASAAKDAERAREQLAGAHAQALELQASLGARAQDVTDALAAQRRAEAHLADALADIKLLRGETEQLKQRCTDLEEQRNAQRALCDRLEAQLAQREKEAGERARQLETERDAAVRAHADAQLSVREALQQATQLSAQAAQERAQAAARADEALQSLSRAEKELARVAGEKEALERSEAVLREQLRQASRKPLEPDEAAAQLEMARAEAARLSEQLAAKARDAEALRAIAQASEEAGRAVERALAEMRAKAEAAERSAAEDRAASRAEVESAQRKLRRASARRPRSRHARPARGWLSWSRR